MTKNNGAAAAIAGLVMPVLFMVAGPARPHEESSNPLQPKRCVSLVRIDRTDIVDDSNILFYMVDGTIYRNQLPHRCPGLRMADSFMYRTSLNQLCDLDIITVLNNIGIGFMRGPSCGLGSFYPITEDEVALLKAPDVTPEEEPVTPEVENEED